jgi:hypothetical protein
MRRALALALLLAPGAAHAFVRTHTTSADTSACLWWGPRILSFQINPDGAVDQTPEQAVHQVELGFSAWVDTGCSDLGFNDLGTTTELQVGYPHVLLAQPMLSGVVSSPHVIVFRGKACADVVTAGDDCLDPANDDCDNKYGCWADQANRSGDALAYTLVTSEVLSGRILDADTAFDAADFEFRDLLTDVCVRQDLDHCADLANTMAHEAGHFIGLGHSDTQDATMYAMVLAPNETAKRDLSQDDIDGVCSVYPTGKPASRCTAPGTAQVSGIGNSCQSATGGSLAWLAVALLLRPRRVAGRDPRRVLL